MMSDITAVVLTIGEETTQRALDSLKRQTVLPEEIIVIRDVTPFHKALNLGASKVQTEFFIQVDSDMILDENCLEDLRGHMIEDNNLGIVVGPLRDTLVELISGVKMFRKKCFEKIQFKNSVSPDTDYYNDIEKYGWKCIYVLNLRYSVASNGFCHTFGEHRPTYTPLYTYSKYYVLGRRYRYRKDFVGLNWRFRQLECNYHDLSLMAQIGMAHGLFSEEEKDLLKPYSRNKDFDVLENFSKGRDNSDIKSADILLRLTLGPKTVFEEFYKLGIGLRRSNSFSGLERCMNILAKGHGGSSCIAKLSLCHGIFYEDYNEKKVNKEYEMLKELLQVK